MLYLQPFFCTEGIARIPFKALCAVNGIRVISGLDKRKRMEYDLNNRENVFRKP